MYLSIYSCIDSLSLHRDSFIVLAFEFSDVGCYDIKRDLMLRLRVGIVGLMTDEGKWLDAARLGLQAQNFQYLPTDLDES